ncbi:lipocalin family protein [Rhodobacteraceae bacterium DSL-40]|uniref:lipocalin family protein n=1 Tax=Amaricoccus sp. B4 TaxID=3368557 RepID=UPI000DAED6EA
MRSVLIALCGALAACTGSSYRDTGTPIVAQSDFQPERYLGLWYEIARYPVFFEKGCTATTAEYGRIDAETISVLNTCRKDTPDGPAETAAGKASIVGPGKLKVKFDRVPFVRGDYWVLWVDESYQTAVVGVPSGSAGWILARTPTIDAARRAKAEAVLEANGYDPSRLYDVPQAAK